MSAKNNRNTVRTFYANVARKNAGEDIDLAQHFTPDAEWKLPRTSPLHGKLKGPEAIAGLFDGAVEDYYQPGSMRYDYHAELAEGHFVMMQFTLKAITANGANYENDYAILFRLQDGLIAEVKEFFDTSLLFSALGNPATANN